MATPQPVCPARRASHSQIEHGATEPMLRLYDEHDNRSTTLHPSPGKWGKSLLFAAVPSKWALANVWNFFGADRAIHAGATDVATSIENSNVVMPKFAVPIGSMPRAVSPSSLERKGGPYFGAVESIPDSVQQHVPMP